MTGIISKLETKQDIDNYKEWLSTKTLNQIKLYKDLMEIEKGSIHYKELLEGTIKCNPSRWMYIDLRIRLMEDEIKNREQ